jgi:hypothetical protein
VVEGFAGTSKTGWGGGGSGFWWLELCAVEKKGKGKLLGVLYSQRGLGACSTQKGEEWGGGGLAGNIYLGTARGSAMHAVQSRIGVGRLLVM